MNETGRFKIFICLILTAMVAGLSFYFVNGRASDVGGKVYEDAVFVENSGAFLPEGDVRLWNI